MDKEQHTKQALITGASRGFGLALATELANQDWELIITGRDSERLLKVKRELSAYTNVYALAGDVRDEVHLLEIAECIALQKWTLDLVVNNASALGPSPMQPLLNHSIDDLHKVLHTNVIAPLSLLQKIQAHLTESATIINISSDAATNAYEKWGGYGSSKAALDHMTRILSRENEGLRFLAFDPGDMRTDMHQQAFPGEDISDRPLPQEIAVPAFMDLLYSNIQDGRHSTESLKTTHI